MNRTTRAWSIVVATATLSATLLAGCATMNPSDEEAAPDAHVAATEPRPTMSATDEAHARNEAIARQHLADATALYDRGEYVAALRLLMTSDEIGASSIATQVEARKVVAFSQCLLNRPKPCRESFDAILAMDPGFELKPAEAGHPMWGKAYLQAKAAARGKVAGN